MSRININLEKQIYEEYKLYCEINQTSITEEIKRHINRTIKEYEKENGTDLKGLIIKRENDITEMRHRQTIGGNE